MPNSPDPAPFISSGGCFDNVDAAYQSVSQIRLTHVLPVNHDGIFLAYLLLPRTPDTSAFTREGRKFASMNGAPFEDHGRTSHYNTSPYYYYPSNFPPPDQYKLTFY